MPCQRLAVKDAEGAAERAKLLDGEGHGHTLSRAARPPRQPRSLNQVFVAVTLKPQLMIA